MSMSPRAQTVLLQVLICSLATAALTYCSLLFLTVLANNGMTFKDFDGAAWTQALGSIAAIVAAIFIASRQSMAELDFRRSEAAERITLRVMLTSAALNTLNKMNTYLQPDVDTGFLQARDADSWTQLIESGDRIRRAIGSIGFSDLAFDSEFWHLDGTANIWDSTRIIFTSEKLRYTKDEVLKLYKLRQILESTVVAYQEVPAFSRSGRKPRLWGRAVVKPRHDLGD